MSREQASPQADGITIADMNGRIEELERQRNEAFSRCAHLAGANALARKTLLEALAEIERLNGLIPQAAALAQPDRASASLD
jgi:hypothetical protein